MGWNYVDVSRETLDRRWNSLFHSFGMSLQEIDLEVSAERGEPLPGEALSDEDILAAEEETRVLVEKWLYRPLRGYYSKFCPNWNVTDDEVMDVCVPASMLFSKQFPEFSLNPVVQKVDDWVDQSGAAIQMCYGMIKIHSIRRGVPKVAPKGGDLSEKDTSSKTQTGSGLEPPVQEPVRKTENEL